MNRRSWIAFVAVSTVLTLITMTGLVTVVQHADARKHSREMDALVKVADKQHQADLARITELEAALAQARRHADAVDQQLAAAAERNRAANVRASRSRRLSPPVHKPVDFASAEAWANSPFARKVAYCESGRDGSAVSHTGKYRGKWQMDADFWRTYGGLKYASSPDLATVAEQDEVAYRGWQARGWQPWTCARMV